MRTRAQTLGNASSPSSSPPRSHSPASPYINCVRSHNVSSGSFASSSSSSPYQAASASTPSTSQKHRQQQYAEHHHHHHHPNMTRFDSTSSSRASYGPGSGSGAAPPQSLPRSLVASASGSLNGHCLERFAYRLADSWLPPQSKSCVSRITVFSRMISAYSLFPLFLSTLMVMGLVMGFPC